MNLTILSSHQSVDIISGLDDGGEEEADEDEDRNNRDYIFLSDLTPLNQKHDYRIEDIFPLLETDFLLEKHRNSYDYRRLSEYGKYISKLYSAQKVDATERPIRSRYRKKSDIKNRRNRNGENNRKWISLT